MRKYIGKAQVTVLDFIGNFRRAHILPILLSGKNPMAMTRNEKSIIEMDYPEGCNVQFDMKLIDEKTISTKKYSIFYFCLRFWEIIDIIFIKVK